MLLNTNINFNYVSVCWLNKVCDKLFALQLLEQQITAFFQSFQAARFSQGRIGASKAVSNPSLSGQQSVK